jgi:hypothetical protein
MHEGLELNRFAVAKRTPKRHGACSAVRPYSQPQNRENNPMQSTGIVVRWPQNQSAITVHLILSRMRKANIREI